jgi:hypothetical protein
VLGKKWDYGQIDGDGKNYKKQVVKERKLFSNFPAAENAREGRFTILPSLAVVETGAWLL